MTDKAKTQRQKFTEMVRDVEADPGEKRWEERLKRVVRVTDAPVPEPKGPLREKRKAP